jgi:hypothetical protein
MEDTGLFCLAEADAKNPANVLCRLPTPLDLTTGQPFELRVLNVRFQYKQFVLSDLWLTSVDKDEETETINFDNLTVFERNDTLNILKKQLVKQFGTLNPRAKISVSTTNNQWVLVIQPQSTVVLSKNLGELLGIISEQKIVNEEKKQVQITVHFKSYDLTIPPKKFHLFCENVNQNLVLPDGGLRRTTAIVNIPPLTSGATWEYQPVIPSYLNLSGGILNSIAFQLVDFTGKPLSSDGAPITTVLFHIRPKLVHEPLPILFNA